ncbi:hypothetical protein DFH08DRAFT_805374 [Mycena albidolilacea]|uniref:Uncharacterized protein n=1 Tax=Mycena albidolilacea TaxID=1033008 RepID=A0AAD7EV81_9AGAR|nr:hypothetical protein DFH08DRAFT_805374 [Mycena albidolilacea]
MGKRLKAPDSESINELEARLADMKKGQSEKCPQGRSKGFKNRTKALQTGAEGDTTIDTPTDANANGAMPSKEPKPAKEPKSERINENILWKSNGVIMDLFHKP